MNLDRYAELLATARPVVIESEEEHDHMLSVAEGLMEKGENLGPEEEKLLALVVLLIEAFESTVEGSDPDEDEDDGPAEPPKPHETLRRLLEARGLELRDISDFFGNPQIAREALEGRRPISRGQAKQLGNYFRVPPKLFHP
ncbi:MAG: transcriptional regulator [Bryobacteraceae bacterium]